jgi:hypothetical protein
LLAQQPDVLELLYIGRGSASKPKCDKNWCGGRPGCALRRPAAMNFNGRNCRMTSLLTFFPKSCESSLRVIDRKYTVAVREPVAPR